MPTLIIICLTGAGYLVHRQPGAAFLMAIAGVVLLATWETRVRRNTFAEILVILQAEKNRISEALIKAINDAR